MEASVRNSSRILSDEPDCVVEDGHGGREGGREGGRGGREGREREGREGEREGREGGREGREGEGRGERNVQSMTLWWLDQSITQDAYSVHIYHVYTKFHTDTHMHKHTL